MSDGMDSLMALKERVERNEARMDQEANFRHSLRGEIASLTTNYAIILTQLENLSKDVEDQGAENKERFKALTKGVYAAATLLVALAGLVLKGQVG